MKLYYVNEATGTYEPAGKKEILAGAQYAARLQHLKPTICNSSALIQYLQLQMMLLATEQLRVIYVNNENRILCDEVLSEGTEDQTAVYPRKIMQSCLLKNATGIIVTHNHPTGQLRPSNADISITRQIDGACSTLDIRFLDHVIVGVGEDLDKGYFSFRENGLL